MDNRIGQLKSLINEFADPCDEIIYHYTSATGFRGIIENSEIWLTNTAFVNDTTECKAFQEKNNLFDAGDITNDIVKQSWENFIDPRRNTYDDNHTYIASFSRGEKESLEQWRAYGNFRIGFKANELIFPPFKAYKCVYNEGSIKDWIIEKSNIVQWQAAYLDDQCKRFAADHLIYAASRQFKNNNFENEKEVRIIVVSYHSWGIYANSPSMFKNYPPIHYRDHQIYTIPVPYVKLIIPEVENRGNNQNHVAQETYQQMKKSKLEEEKNMTRKLLPIKEIFIGPMMHQKEARVSCEILLSDNGYKDYELKVSDIPYRGF